ncbi:MAG: phosphatase PAP2 family protein [Bifidobacterium sp.]|jgi:membrane-associated phospholipid phosphatase|nr:phosphatase PAP2 family protein [Bifidobacterium sp.]
MSEESEPESENDVTAGDATGATNDMAANNTGVDNAGVDNAHAGSAAVDHAGIEDAAAQGAAASNQGSSLPALPVFTPLPESSAAAYQRSSYPVQSQSGHHESQDNDLAGLAGFSTQPGSLSSNAGAVVQGDFGRVSDGAGDDAVDDDLERGLARLDPLAVRPRISSRILCALFALLFALLAAGAWWLGVRTMNGQNYDEAVYTGLGGAIAGWLRPVTDVFTNSKLVIALSIVTIAVAALVAALRRRWWLLGQMAGIGALVWVEHYLKDILPRPFIVNIVSSQKNSAPSGHTLLAAAAGMVLLIAVGRAWRACAAVLGGVYAVLIGMSVIVGGWHRPTDVVMAILLIGAASLLALAFTRASGMDAPGRRASSPGVQIVASVMITLGVLGGLYAGYIIWQIEPGLALSERWIHDGAIASAIVLIAAASALVFGLALAMRQLTASPLSKFGLVGAPPVPPEPATSGR